MNQSICYLSNNFSYFDFSDKVDLIKSPEGLMNEDQIKTWVESLRTNPKVFATTSLFLVRELDLKKINVKFVNVIFNPDGSLLSVKVSNSCDDIGELEILQRELKQSDDYMNHE